MDSSTKRHSATQWAVDFFKRRRPTATVDLDRTLSLSSAAERPTQVDPPASPQLEVTAPIARATPAPSRPRIARVQDLDSTMALAPPEARAPSRSRVSDFDRTMAVPKGPEVAVLRATDPAAPASDFDRTVAVVTPQAVAPARRPRASDDMDRTLSLVPASRVPHEEDLDSTMVVRPTLAPSAPQRGEFDADRTLPLGTLTGTGPR